jgi:hypothetical protein
MTATTRSNTKKTARAKGAKQTSEVRKLAKAVRGAIDDGASAVEEIHKTIAEAPLEVLQRLEVLPNTMADVRRLQDDALTAIYRAVRKVNHEVTDFTADLLEGTPRRRAPVRKTGAKARRPRTAKSEATRAKAQTG